MIKDGTCFGELCLHGTLIDQHSIELNERIVSAASFAENDSRDAAAYTVGSIGDHGFLDMADSFAKVLL